VLSYSHRVPFLKVVVENAVAEQDREKDLEKDLEDLEKDLELDVEEKHEKCVVERHVPQHQKEAQVNLVTKM